MQQTDDDAAGSRLSAVQAGYLEDDFALAMWEGNANTTALPRRMPIINRGTYVRTVALDAYVDAFLEEHAGAPVVQFLSLGAGTDTRFFRMVGRRPELLGERVRYHEVDFAATTARKIRAVERTEGLRVLLGEATDAASGSSTVGAKDGDGNIDGRGDAQEKEDEGVKHGDNDSSSITPPSKSPPSHSNTLIPTFTISDDKTSIRSTSYFLHAIDLRSLASTNPPPIPHVLPTAPTLILSECCLTYLPSTTSNSLLHHLTRALLPAPTPLTILLYEPLHPTDAFGRTMLSNLSGRGIVMPGLEAFPTLEAHGERLKEVGFEAWEGATVREVWDTRVSREEKARLRRMEMVDEEEEWVLLAGHYGVVKGWRGTT